MRGIGVSLATYQRWKTRYGGMKKDALKRLRELEKENARLKRVVADLTLDKAILKEIAEGTDRREIDCVPAQPEG